MKASAFKTLAGLTRRQWEALCDGCAKCCVQKLIDADSGAVLYSNVACRWLDVKTCRCTSYASRHHAGVECVELTPESILELDWMPATCAYRLIAAGKPLPAWHPLVTGDRRSTERAGMSMKGRLVAARDAGPIEDHVVLVQAAGRAPARRRRAASGRARHRGPAVRYR
jgi:uncharacterized cysteine cluster protein YcgN (CxxCxxCC family)